MSWDDYVFHILHTSGQVQKMVVYDLSGSPVAVTKDFETSCSEGMALVKCVMDPRKTVTKLDIDGDSFLCFQGIGNTFIGTSVKSPDVIVAAYQEGDHVIAAVGNSSGGGSIIHELKKGLVLKSEGKLVTEKKVEQSKARQQQQQQELEQQRVQQKQQAHQKQGKKQKAEKKHKKGAKGKSKDKLAGDLVDLFCDSIDRAQTLSNYPQTQTSA